MCRSAARKLGTYSALRLCLAVREVLPGALFSHMLSVTVWMNMPSFYQDDLFCQLAHKVDLRVVYDHAIAEDRRRLGWAELKGEYHSCVLGQNRKVRHAINIARSERDRIHIINGIWAETAFTAVSIVLGKMS